MKNFFTRHKSFHVGLLVLAWPMIVSNISVPLLGLVDTGVIGHLSDASFLAGVALGSMVINLLFWLAGFLRMSTTGLVAQAYGKDNKNGLLQELKRAALFAFAVALLLLAISPVISHFMGLFLSGSDAAIKHAQTYFNIRIFSAPAALLNIVLLAWMLGTQYSKGTLMIVLVTNVANIVLDIVFVVGFDWQVEGAALASVCADYIGLIAAVLLLKARFAKHGLSFSALLKISLDGLTSALKLNRDIFIRSLFLQLCFAFMTYYGGFLGDATLAANAVLLNFLLLVSFALDGIAYAVEAKVGQAKGRKKAQAIHLWVVIGRFWAFIFACLYSVMFLLLGSWIISVLTDLPNVLATAEKFLIWSIILPPIASFCFLYDGVFVGLTRAKEMRNTMIFSALVGFAGVFAVSYPLGNHGLWLAMTCFMALRGLTLAKKYHDFWRSRQLLQ
ncbi:MATE family efflux transporter [Pseudoalteromonas spongiae]|uniref:MATE family efflux transporter n=1 Tax=Pseudoalteromonas spongiae TaxID=298657 RepID=UPI00026C914E|nr:MATE family efflux transporter [Pseudoalteromonas spongiae]